MVKINLYKKKYKWAGDIEKVLGIEDNCFFIIKSNLDNEECNGTYEAIYDGIDFNHLFFRYYNKDLNKICNLAVSPEDIFCESIVLMKNHTKLLKDDLVSPDMIYRSDNLKHWYPYKVKSNLFVEGVRYCMYMSYDRVGYHFIFYNEHTQLIDSFWIKYDNVDKYEVYELEMGDW